ncbi:AI-2E family transporter [Paracoccus sanguinis]|uniref:AI-2E family transporter n=1 Tax=Paracoccus sanguinis TaxID=1545044 RepID=UPI000ABDA792|nr:AI-2E family transporter [Paracoccus sanguinis]
MQMSATKQALWWGGAAAVLLLALWLLGGAILPFVLGMGIAYMLDPVADRLERAGLSRTLAVVFITLIVVLALAALLLWLGPLLVRQAGQLVESTPDLLNSVQSIVRNRFPEFMPDGGMIDTAVEQIRTTLTNSLGGLMGTLMGSLRSVVGVFMVLIIAPVVAFYMLLDWDRMIERIDNLLPRQHAPTIRRIFAQIDDSVAGFVRGEALVILILATLYSTGLMLIGLPFGIVIGVAAALLSFIPYVGTLVGGVLSIGVAVATFWGDWPRIGGVAAIFAAGQMLESNVLQPKIVGGHVGLHPVWLMLSLSVFGVMFGFLGLLIAVPVGAAVGVIVRFMAEQYKESALYTGREVMPAPAPPMLVEMVPPGTTAEARRRSEVAHRAAAAEARVDEARFEARVAARDAARADGARVAEARMVVRGEGAEAAAAAEAEAPEVRTWGGKTPDGTDPADPEGKEARKDAAEDREEADDARRAAEAFREGPVRPVADGVVAVPVADVPADPRAEARPIAAPQEAPVARPGDAPRG